MSDPAPLQPAVRAQFDDLVELGEGGMGMVLRGRDKKLGRVVAIKVIKPELVSDPRIMSRAKREVLCLARVRHPAIVQIYQFETPEGEAPFFTMEYVPGKTLWHVMHMGLMKARAAVELVAAVADGVAAVHAAGLLHRDIKPGNIMVTSDGSPKLMDFGLSTFLDSSHTRLTATQELLGTMGYLPPEVIAGRRSDERSDVFCLGLVLYEVLTGKTARDRDDVAALFNDPSAARPLHPGSDCADLDPRLDAIVAEATHGDPAKRTASAAALRSALEGWLAAPPAVAPPRPAPRAKASAAHRSTTGKHVLEPAVSDVSRVRRRAGWALVAATVLAVAGAAWYRYGPRPASSGGSPVEAALERLAAPGTTDLDRFLDDLDLVPAASRDTLAGLARRWPHGHEGRALALARVATLTGDHEAATVHLAEALTEVRRRLVAAGDAVADADLRLEGRLFMRSAAAGWAAGLHRPAATSKLEALLLGRSAFRLNLVAPVRRRPPVRLGRGLERFVLAEALLRRGDRASLDSFEDLGGALGAFAEELGQAELLSGQLLRYEKLAGRPADLRPLQGQRLELVVQELKDRIHEETKRPTVLSPAAAEGLELAVRKARRLLWRAETALAAGELDAKAASEAIRARLELAQVGRAATLVEVRATEYLGPGFGQPLLLQQSLEGLEELFALHGSRPDAFGELLAASLRWIRQIKRGDVSRVEQLKVALEHLDAGSPLRRYLDGQVLTTLGRVAEGVAAGGEALRSLLAATASSAAAEPAELPLLAALAELRFQQDTELAHTKEHADELRAVAALGGDGAASLTPTRLRLFALAALHEANALLVARRGSGTRAVLPEPLRRRLERVIAVANDETHARKARQLLDGKVAYDTP